MRRAVGIKQDLTEIQTVEGLTSVFESIASIRIGRIKNRVLASKQFFAELWQIYSSLRVDPAERLTAGERQAPKGHKPEVYVVITSEGGLTGDIDERIVSRVLADYNPETTDLIVVGDHGYKLMSGRRIPMKQYFKTPESSESVDVGPVVSVVMEYAKIQVYYETYVSLSVQQTAKIDLIAAVKSMSDEVGQTGTTISSRDYVFEPSLPEIIAYLEHTMVSLALSQVILESKLAQDASRFNAMSAAKDKASELVGEYRLKYNRAKRAESDGRLKEVIVSMNNTTRGGDE